MPDLGPDAGIPAPPTPDGGNPWLLAKTGLAAVAAGLVAYVGVSAAQVLELSAPGAPSAAPVADAPIPLVAPPAATPSENPSAPATYASEPKQKAEPSRSERRPAKPEPSKAAEPKPAKSTPSPRSRTKADAAAPTRQEKLEVKHATWADRQLARMLRSVPASPINWYGGTWVLPTSGYHLTATFGESGRHWSSTHTGLDFAAPTGTPVRAVTGGTVTSTGYAGAYGNRIVLTHPDGSETWYCHLSRINVPTGSQVGTGAVIGAVGATGNVTGPHLHLEVRTSGDTPVDPYQALLQHGVRP